jgi:hypothetical protein
MSMRRIGSDVPINRMPRIGWHSIDSDRVVVAAMLEPFLAALVAMRAEKPVKSPVAKLPLLIKLSALAPAEIRNFYGFTVLQHLAAYAR